MAIIFEGGGRKDIFLQRALAGRGVGDYAVVYVSTVGEEVRMVDQGARDEEGFAYEVREATINFFGLGGWICEMGSSEDQVVKMDEFWDFIQIFGVCFLLSTNLAMLRKEDTCIRHVFEKRRGYKSGIRVSRTSWGLRKSQSASGSC